MIDVHVLTHEGTRPEWLVRCLSSLEGEPVTVHVIDNTGCSVGEGRAKGYALGHHEFVSYLDSDDELLPGTYARMLEEMKVHHAVCAQEWVVSGSGYVCPTARKGHAPLCFRRGDIAPLIQYMAASPWCVDMFVRRILQPVALDWVGARAHISPPGERLRPTRDKTTKDQYETERLVWPI